MPAEIRNTIWESSFVENRWKYLLDARQKSPPPSHDLLATCSQINNEAKGLYSRAQQRYWQDTGFLGLCGEDNTLFHETRELIKGIPAEKCNQIQHLQFVLDRNRDHTVFTMLFANRDHTVYTMLFAKGAGWMADSWGKIFFTRMRDVLTHVVVGLSNISNHQADEKIQPCLLQSVSHVCKMFMFDVLDVRVRSGSWQKPLVNGRGIFRGIS
ncbi:hypothetical protein Slin15195_G023520 [Septoria linicola]|uniref:Uncharacterized protein n=1 Tax=Septoria linicola TaxID=215465 RepID=A0A9Q9AMX3_9PEZI|nr:hypothetical protein Slin15195_G023520 [Septoria linicola]